MKYFSTRDSTLKKDFKDIVLTGLSSEGGLYLPKEWPKLKISNFKNLDYSELAFEIIYPFCNNIIPQEDLRIILDNTYKKFSHPKIAPLISLSNNKHILELFYGPTFAFKDYALQFLGNLIEFFLNQEKNKITIIGATSGDTGSAAINAFKLKTNINIFILYPHEKISEIQRRQMTTILEKNVHNIAVKGSFDDCQTIVKSLFVDQDLLSKTKVTAINSINWARIISQSVYYFWAFLQMNNFESKVNFVVPSGNFGNVYAGRVAKKLGLPINILHVVTNTNDILHRIISNGEMITKNVVKTYSPSMDIQMPSNFERQLFESLNFNSDELISIMNSFIYQGGSKLNEEIVENLSTIYRSYTVTDQEILKTIKLFSEQYNYLPDPHTANALNILEKIDDPNSQNICLACAHPSKFNKAIKKATGKEADYPDSLKNIFSKKEKFNIFENDIISIKEYIINNLS